MRHEKTNCAPVSNNKFNAAPSVELKQSAANAVSTWSLQMQASHKQIDRSMSRVTRRLDGRDKYSLSISSGQLRLLDDLH